MYNPITFSIYLMEEKNFRKPQKDKNLKIPKKYLSGFKGEDREKRAEEIKKRSEEYKKGNYIKISSDNIKSRKKKSSYTIQFHKKYGSENAGDLKKISKVTGVPESILQEVLKRGKGAFFSSGSRPGQTPESWGMARVYSFVMNGKTRYTADKDLSDKLKIIKNNKK